MHAQESTSAEKKAVQETILNFFDALSHRDSVQLKSFSTVDISLFEYGQIWNIDTLILKAITLNQSADFKRANSFEFINTRGDRDLAWVSYRLQSIIFKEGTQVTIRWLETVVLVKEQQRWKIKHLHSTLINRN